MWVARHIMLLSAKRRRQVTSGILSFAATAPAVPADEVGRLCALAARSRERLAKWTDLPLPEGVLPGMRPDEIPPAGKQIMDPRSKWFQQYHSLGEHEGCGILLMIAKLDPCGKGKIEAAELQKFYQEIDMMVENVLGSTSTVLVVVTLIFAITIPLLVDHTPASFDPSDSPSLGGSWPYGAEWYSSWLNSRALAVLYWLELVSFVGAVFMGVKGMIVGLILYINLTTYAPDTESRVYCLYDNPVTIANLNWACLGSIFSLLAGLIFMMARASPIASILIAVCTLIVPFLTLSPGTHRALLQAPALNQLRVGREIIAVSRGQRAAVVAASAVVRVENVAEGD